MSHFVPCPVHHRLINRSFLLLLISVMFPVVAAAQSSPPRSINDAFEQAAGEWDVPRDLLVTIAYAETHFDDHNGEPSVDNGFGLMHLVDNPQTQTLNQAARILGMSAARLKTDPEHNIRGGAAILRAYADEQGLTDQQRDDLAAWYAVVARYSNAQNVRVADQYADEIYRLLNMGIQTSTPDGQVLRVRAQAVEPPPRSTPAGLQAEAQSTDYPTALWVPAHTSNYRTADRERDYPIKYIVIHTTQGTYASAVNWFHIEHGTYGPTSAHYVIRSRDGEITQTVREKDIAYHAGNWTYNTQSIGIEHEGWVSNPQAWYTDAMYKASAALTRSIAQKYGIPLDRSHIIGHSEVPGATHTDPGPGWNWSYYMQLVRQETLQPAPTPPDPTTLNHRMFMPFMVAGSGWSTILDNAQATQFNASSTWDSATFNTQRYGNDYRVVSPQAVADTAWFRADLPAIGAYEVFAWYPSAAAYNVATPFVIKTVSGNQIVRVNQQANGGQWVSLGTFTLNAGSGDVVGVSRWSTQSGYIVADAVMLVQR